jgi:hypothetical protein
VLAKPCIGDKVVLQVNMDVEGEEDTILKYSGGAPMLFNDMYIGAPVSSTGFLREGDVWSALQITLGANLANK